MSNEIPIPKQKKRYSSEQEILDAIENLRKKADECDRNALELDGFRLSAIQNSAKSEADGVADVEFWREQANEFRLKASKLRLTAGNIRERRIKEMGERLAEFQTEPMMFVGLDRSIQA
jgi:hypothetical protein